MYKIKHIMLWLVVTGLVLLLFSTHAIAEIAFLWHDKIAGSIALNGCGNF
jgi:hypothetical protein